MTVYYDTGILLKLYTEEIGSPIVRAFVTRRKKALRMHDFHRTECVSAIRLKPFRGECTVAQASEAIGHIAEDIRAGVLKLIEVDWAEVWRAARSLADAHCGKTGCRTLDTLHIACARLLGAKQFVTSDQRQQLLARLTGLQVINPLK